MRHKAQFKVMLPAGRFATEAHRKFFAAIGNAFRQSREFTSSEVAVVQIQDSLDNDVKSGARVHAHGNDVQTITKQRMAAVDSNIAAEVLEAEATCLQAEIEAHEAILKALQTRLHEIQGVRGFTDSRTIELDKARERIAQRAAAQQAEARMRAAAR